MSPYTGIDDNDIKELNIDMLIIHNDLHHLPTLHLIHLPKMTQNTQ